MNTHRACHKLLLLVPFALLAPACIGAPPDGADDAPSAETRRSAQTSGQKPTEGDNGGNNNTGGGGSSTPVSLGVTFDDCTNDGRRSEMKAALNDILANWSDFDANLNARGVTGSHDCMLNRLTDNGTVQCEACDLAGHSAFLGDTAHICRSWASGVEDRYPSSLNSRKICWASVIMHEFGHTCLRFEDGAEEIDNAARDTLNDIYGLSLDLDAECNQDS